MDKPLTAALHRQYRAARTTAERDALWRDILRVDQGKKVQSPGQRRTAAAARLDPADEADPVVPMGPYMNEEGDWWVPVAGNAFRTARALVVACLDDVFPLAYLGKQKQWLDSEHESGCAPDCPANRYVLAYHFEERRRD